MFSNRIIRILTIMSILFSADYFYVSFVNARSHVAKACLIPSVSTEYNLAMLITLAFMLGAFFAFLISYFSAAEMRQQLSAYLDSKRDDK